MENITILDKEFEIYLRETQIMERVSILAKQINQNHRDKQVVFTGILNGSFMFASDLLKNIDLSCQISFLKMKSYIGTSSSGVIQELIGLREDLTGKTVLVIEDIIDTGNTIERTLEILKSHNPESIHIISLIFKPEAYTKTIPIDYVGFEIPDKFIVGYGLDYEGFGRNLKDIYILKNQ